MRSKKQAIVVLIGAVLMWTACSGVKKTAFVDETANFGAVQRVAMLPLQNFTGDANAPEKVGQIVSIYLLRARAFELVDPREVSQALVTAQVESVGEMTPDQVRQVGELLGAQALLNGTVRELSIDRSTGVNSPSVALQFDLVDAPTGTVIWSSVVSRQGPGTSARLFGVGGRSTNETIMKLVDEAFATLID